MYEYQAKITRVVDGDTVHAEIDVGFDIHFDVILRLMGINAPEMSTPEGKVAKQWLYSRLYNTVPDGIDPYFIIRTVKDRKEKYGRYLAYIIDSKGNNINEEMVQAGMAVEYNP